MKICAKKQRNAPLTDMFTLLCNTDLKVVCVKEYRFHAKRRWRFDYAIPDYKVALEVEGGIWTHGRHTRATGFLGDMEKYNTATIMGWRLLRTTPENLCKQKTIEMIRQIIDNIKTHETYHIQKNGNTT